MTQLPALALALTMPLTALAQPDPMLLDEFPNGAILNDYAPEWWPDGSKLIYSSRVLPDGTNQLLTVPVAGGEIQQFSSAPGQWTFARFSPDGTKLAAVGNTDGSDSVYLLDLDGKPIRRLTEGGYGGFDRLAWSPDSKKLVFPWDRDGHTDIWIIDTETGEAQRVTDDLADQGPADWSPDGEWIAFMSRTEGTPSIHRIRPDGTDLERLSSTGMLEWWPSYSPDGSSIAYWAGNGPDYNLLIMTGDGKEHRALTDRRDWNWCPSWSPDGLQIAFDSRHDGIRGICVMDSDGSDVHKLTNTASSSFAHSVLDQGVDQALSRLAYSRRVDPDRMYTARRENQALVRTLIDQGRIDEAVRFAEWNLITNPKDSDDADILLMAQRAAGMQTPPLNFELAAALRNGRVDEAIASYEAAKSQYPAWPVLAEGWFAIALNELSGLDAQQDAIRLGEIGVRDYPDSARLHAMLARSLHAHGMRDRALAHAERALQIDAQNSIAGEVLAALK